MSDRPPDFKYLDIIEAQSHVRDLLPPKAIFGARLTACHHINTATDALLAARRELLHVGFGADHPACLALDALAEGCERAHEQTRPGGPPGEPATAPRSPLPGDDEDPPQPVGS